MSLGTLGVKVNIKALKQHAWLLFLIFFSDLMSLDGSQVLSCLSVLLVTFSKLYIQNEILSLQECTIWEQSHDLEDTFQCFKDFQMPRLLCVISFLFFLLTALQLHCFSIIILHFSSHATSNVRPRFQFFVWPFLSYILKESANSNVLPGV